jgi:hypothetical protein
LDKTSECIIVGLTRNGFVVERIEDKKRFNTCHLKFVEEEEDDNQTNSQNSEEHSKLAMITKGESSMIELEPRSYSQAMECEESAYWRAAIQAELDSLRRNGTFGPPQNLPEGKKAVTSKWVFKRKMKQDGTLDKYKARLVARGYTQRAGTDYEDVFAPVVGIKGLKNLIEEMEGKGIKLKIYCDNKATIEVTRNHVLNGKTKHMLSKIAFIRHFLEKKDFDLEYIESKKNLADILTKAPKKETFQKHSRLLGLGGLLEHGDNPMLLESS